jgi:lysophospholipase L1-like esterase
LSLTGSDLVSSRISITGRAEFILKVALLFISPLLFILILEGAAFLWEQKQSNSLFAWELVASRRIELVSYPEPGAGYTLMKPGSHYGWQGIPVDINTYGLRGPEIPFEKPEDTYRILNLGDSVAMGWGVKEDEAYGRRLEALLNRQETGSLRYQVINAGVPGWNLENELAYLQAVGVEYQPDLVVLDLTIVNDIYGKSALLQHDRPALIEWLRANTYFWPFLTVQLRWLEASIEGRERIDVIDPPTKPSSYFPLDTSDGRWSNIWDLLVEMNRISHENGAKFVILLFPLEFQVLDENYPTVPQEFISVKAREAGIPVLDLLPAFRQACRQKPGDSCSREDRYLFADVWMHPSAYGHRLTAQELYLFLDGILE